MGKRIRRWKYPHSLPLICIRKRTEKKKKKEEKEWKWKKGLQENPD